MYFAMQAVMVEIKIFISAGCSQLTEKALLS